MFASNATQGNVMLRSQDIFLRLRTALNDASDFYAWLSAQDDATLGAPNGLGFSPQDITFLRSAYNDVVALRSIANGGQPAATYPQLSGTYNFMVNVKQVIGPT